MNIIVYLLFLITTFSSCEICLGDNLDLILLHTPNGLNMQPHKFCMSCISDWKNKCEGGLECHKCRYKLNLTEQMVVELTVVQRRCTILVEKRQLVLKNDILSTLKKVSYIRQGSKIMQKFMEKVTDNFTERTRNAFRSWRELWEIHRYIRQRNKTMQKFMKKLKHNSIEKKRNPFRSWHKLWQDTFCSKCQSQFDTYFWQRHAKGYFEVKTKNENHEIHQGRLCKDCIKSFPLVEGKKKCPFCREEIIDIPVCETNTTIDTPIFYPLALLFIHEYRYKGHLASNLENFLLRSWINRYFTNFAITACLQCFSKIAYPTDFGGRFEFLLSKNIEFATYCSIVEELIILWTINMLTGKQNLIFQYNLVAKIGYPALASFISQIYNPTQFSSRLDHFFPDTISNVLIAICGNYFLEDFIGKLHTYEFGYTGRLIEKIMKKHLGLIVFFIELTLLLNVYEFSTFFFVVGCLLLVLTLINKQIK